MRKHKFRAWDTEEEKMLYEVDISSDGYVMKHEYGNYVGVVEELIVIEYTGMQDMEGTDIYEGHICWDKRNECYGVIEFDEGKYVFVWDNIVEDLCEVNKEIEIDGNIFEDVHLLG